MAALAGAIVSNLASFTISSITENSKEEEKDDNNIIASIPLRTRTTTTTPGKLSNDNLKVGTTRPQVLGSSNVNQATASVINTASGIFQVEESASQKEKTNAKAQATSKEAAKVLEVSCSFAEDSSPSQENIIFNEINWAGSSDNSNHEWIELKNISDSDLDISGYEILDLKEQIQIKIPNGVTLPRNALYLLKRGEDTLSSISAPTYTGALSNSSEGLRLFNNNCDLEDEALAEPSWPAGDSKERLTMERKSNLDWQSSESSGGTPAKSNSKGQEEDQSEQEDSSSSNSSSENEGQEESNPNEGVFDNEEEQGEKSETPPAEEEEPQNETSSDCIDINSASLEELDEIKGVGPSIGQKIIDARPFSSLDELDDKVSGIGESRLADIIAEGKACVG